MMRCAAIAFTVLALSGCSDEIVERRVVMRVDGASCGTDVPEQLLMPCGATIIATVRRSAVGVEDDSLCAIVQEPTRLSDMGQILNGTQPLAIDSTVSGVEIAVTLPTFDEFDCIQNNNVMLAGFAPVFTDGPTDIPLVLSCQVPPGTGDPQPDLNCINDCYVQDEFCINSGTPPEQCDLVLGQCLMACEAPTESCLERTNDDGVPTTPGNP